ncbi:hypothetical protein ACTI_20170 [Actinoplanes sp. OR16]|uniref:hypothetical protein n=1 Tax=Actinoplanes sp. OR16 TaxID=946334 RepID=UPI000F6F744D|nr:hypothetical protein [Actinoplanes sp. OR16]BBH65332.1 hypothetical protein ACTI_20170 [Actinoplanes sp. OR16]
MDVFARTFHQAADAGSASPAAYRHMTIFRNCVDQDDAAVLVARCARPGLLFSGGHHYLMLTQRRLVVIQEMRPLHRQRLHLNANLRHLDNVSWQLSRTGIELALTAVDGVRERFRLRLGSSEAIWRVEELFRQMFHGRRVEAVAPAPRRAATLAFS